VFRLARIAHDESARAFGGQRHPKALPDQKNALAASADSAVGM
jgi:hypothetical protein